MRLNFFCSIYSEYYPWIFLKIPKVLTYPIILYGYATFSRYKNLGGEKRKK